MEEILEKIFTELVDLKQGQRNLEQGQGRLELRLDGVDQRLDDLDQRQSRLEQGQLNLTDRMKSFESQVNYRFNQTDKKIDMIIDTIAGVKEDITSNSMRIQLVDDKIRNAK